MKRNVSKLSDLKKQYNNIPDKGNLSFQEFIQNISNNPGFWDWFFDGDYDGALTQEQKNKFEIFIKKSKYLGSLPEKKREKDTNLHILLTSNEKKIIQNNARKQKISLSEYVRNVSLNYEIKSKTDIETAMQIRKIGVNINQIAYKINREPTNKNINIGLSELKLQWEYLQKILDKIQ